MDDLDVQVMLGSRATALDAKRRMVGFDAGHELPFEQLIIATGADPDRVFTARSTTLRCR